MNWNHKTIIFKCTTSNGTVRLRKWDGKDMLIYKINSGKGWVPDWSPPRPIEKYILVNKDTWHSDHTDIQVLTEEELFLELL